MKHTALCFFGLSLQALTVAACGSSSSNKTTESDAGTEGGAANEASAPPGPPAWADAGAPITGASDMTWTWVPVPEAQCRDGSKTGFWINPNMASKKLVIFLEGGGAC